MVLAYHTSFVTLAAFPLEELVDFYRLLLGIEPSLWLPGSYAELQLKGLRLGIFQPRSESLAEFLQYPTSALSICIEVADLDQAIAQFTALGYPPPGPQITNSHGQEVYAYDPAGNRLILFQPGPDVSGPFTGED